MERRPPVSPHRQRDDLPSVLTDKETTDAAMLDKDLDSSGELDGVLVPKNSCNNRKT